MAIATIKVVFDRKHVSDNTSKRGLVQVEVIHNRKQLFISTGVKVLKSQWDSGRNMVKNSLQADNQNATIYAIINNDGAIQGEMHQRWDGIFIRRIEELYIWCKTDKLHRLHEGTHRETRGSEEQHKKGALSAVSVLEEFGKIRYFSDITVENIKMFDDWLHEKGCLQTTIYGRHRVLKTYINEAIRFDRLEANPYRKIKIDKGKSRDGRIVMEEDMKKIMKCKLPESLEKVRDLAIVEFYTGLAVSDLMSFDFSKVTEIDGCKVLLDERQKTGEQYYIFLFKPVLDVLARYGNKLPKMTMQQYNQRLKVVAEYARLDMPEISSHWLRRGAGYWALNNGMPMEVVSKFLGHASIRQTESVYAKLLPKTIISEMKKLEK